MIAQFEFPFSVAAVGPEFYAHCTEAVQLEPGPVMARIWVIEGKRRVQRMWRVDMLHELDRRVWGWVGIGGGK